MKTKRGSPEILKKSHAHQSLKDYNRQREKLNLKKELNQWLRK